jgi:long-chain fatty acid transport protein
MKFYSTIFCLLIGHVLWCQGYQVNLQGQVQQGMGGAGSALINDAATAFFNPAGLSYLEKNQVIVGMTPTFANTLFVQDSTNATGRSNSPVGTPFAVYANYKKEPDSKLGLGLGIYTPFGSTISYEDEWVGRFALTRLQLMSIFFQPSVSYAITDKLHVGAGFVYVYGKVQLQKDLPLQFADGSYGSATLSGTSNGFGFNAGVFYEPVRELSIAATYRSQVNMNLNSGDAVFDVPISLDEKFPDGTFTSSLPLPWVATFSLGSRLNEKIQLVADLNYVGWNAYDTLGFDYENNTESLADTRSAREYKNTIAIRFGAQYSITEKLKARAGIAFAQSPVQEGYVTPETPDNNRLNYTVGLGYQINEHLIIDASCLFTHIERTDTNLETNLSGTFITNVFSPGLSITFQY